MFKRREIAFIICITNIMAATILELNGFNPSDQVFVGLIFGFASILIKEDNEL